jgi:acetyl esterase/lipase
MLRFIIILTMGAIAALLGLGWMTPTKMWQWMLSLGVLEMGHWMALLAGAAALVGALGFRFWMRYLLLAMGMALVLTLFIPTMIARNLEPNFDMNRLWQVGASPLPGALPLHALERKIYYRNTNDTLDALIYRPEDSTVKRPWIVCMHTGGWNSGSVDEFRSWYRELAGHGYVILAPEYHLAPKYKWPRQMEDVHQCVTWARANADMLSLAPEKLVLMGRSAGGQIAAMAALNFPELEAKGCISMYAPFDLKFAHQFSREDDIIGALKLLRQYLGGDPADAEKAYLSASGIEFLRPTMPPILLMHGTRDPIVWVEQARRTKVRAEKQGQGAKVTVVELPWATHGFDYFPQSPGGQVSMQATLRYLKTVVP